MPNIDDYCGYCSYCQEFKDDDFGQWRIEGEDTGNPEIKTYRGCRDCGRTLTSMETIKSHLPELLTDTLRRLQNGKNG